MLHHAVDLSYQRKVLLAEETSLTSALAFVRRKLNKLQPVYCLPSEILEEIFQICVSWLYDYHKPKHRLAWTQVCCLWRQISLNSSRLWQRIDLCDSRFADEFLVRSKEAPLSIVSASPLKLTTNNLPPHVFRLRCIDLFLFPGAMVHLFSNIGRTLPAVTRLSLKVPPNSSTLALDVAIPLVRHLVLDCVSIKWHSCHNLVHISLRGLSPEYCPSITELHDIFAASPNLEHIRLENLTPPSLQIESHRSIPLIHLKDIIISAQLAIVTAILPSLILGPSARLQLFLSHSDSLHTLFPDGLPYLHNSARFSVSIIRLSRHSIHFIRHGPESWSEVPSKTLFSISSASPLNLSTGVCGSLEHLLHLPSITKLELTTGVLLDIPLKVLKELFPELSNLNTLCVAFNDLDGLLDILTHPVDKVTRGRPEGSLPSGAVCLPRLTRLVFGKPTDIWGYFSEMWTMRVMECVRARQMYGVPAETLEFIRCDGIEAANFQAYVNEVIVCPSRRIINFGAK